MCVVQFDVVKRTQIGERALALAVRVFDLVDGKGVVDRAGNDEAGGELSEDGEVIRCIEDDQSQALLPGFLDRLDGVRNYVIVRLAVFTGVLRGNAVHFLGLDGDFHSGVSE